MSAGAEEIRTYDFKHPARINRDQLRRIEALHENGARLLSSTLSSVMRSIVEVRPRFIDQTTYREYIASLSNPSASYQYMLGPTTGHAVMDFELPIVFGVVDRCFGGKGSSEGVELRQMTQAEMGLFAQLVIRAVHDVEAWWEPVYPEVSIHDIELETNPEFMQITADSEIVIYVALDVVSTNMTGRINLCYPYFTLEPILPRLSQPGAAPRPGPARDASRARNRLALGAMDLSTVVELGRTRVSAGQAGNLGVGDVIRLDAQADDPACVFIGGQPRLLGYPCTDDAGQMALRIEGRVPPAHAVNYGRVPVVLPAGDSQPVRRQG